MILDAEMMADLRSLALSLTAILILSLAFANFAESTFTCLSGFDEAYCLNDAIFFIFLITIQISIIQSCRFSISFGQFHHFLPLVIIVHNTTFHPVVYHGGSICLSSGIQY